MHMLHNLHICVKHLGETHAERRDRDHQLAAFLFPDIVEGFRPFLRFLVAEDRHVQTRSRVSIFWAFGVPPLDP